MALRVQRDVLLAAELSTACVRVFHATSAVVARSLWLAVAEARRVVTFLHPTTTVRCPGRVTAMTTRGGNKTQIKHTRRRRNGRKQSASQYCHDISQVRRTILILILHAHVGGHDFYQTTAITTT